MRKLKFNKETKLAKIIIEYLKEMKWEIYQEVQIFSYGKIADIVAVQNNIIWVLECKLSLSLDLIAQAYDWKDFANYVSIVTPSKRHSKSNCMADKILKDYGIGHYTVVSYDSDWYAESSASISEAVCPKLNRKAMSSYIKRSLCEEQKYWAEAGNDKKLRYTPFQGTKKEVIKYVSRNPGCDFKELIKNIKHHYNKDSTAIGCLRQWIKNGVISEIRLDVNKKGKYILFLKENEK